MVRLRMASSKFTCASAVLAAIWHIKRTKLFPVATVYVPCCFTQEAVVTLPGLGVMYIGLALLISVTSICQRPFPSPAFVSARNAHPPKLITSPGFTGKYCDVPFGTPTKLAGLDAASCA